MSQTTEQLIINLVNYQGYASKDQIREVCHKELNRDSATADRKARMAAQDKKIFPYYEGGVLKGYKKYNTSENLRIMEVNPLKEIKQEIKQEPLFPKRQITQYE